MKTLHERNDFEQKKLLLAYFNRSNRLLVEKERLPRSRAAQVSIDFVINQAEDGTELYIPVRQEQDGPLTSLVRQYCKEVFGKHEEGEFQTYAVFRTTKSVNAKDIADKLVKAKPVRLSKYNIELSPAHNFSFSSDAKYAAEAVQAPKAEEPVKQGKIRHTVQFPEKDVQQIRTYMVQGLLSEQIHKHMQKYDVGQIRGIMTNLRLGTYDKPMKEIDDDLKQKLYKSFKDGKSYDDIASEFSLNKFQVIAQKAAYTKQHGKV